MRLHHRQAADFRRNRRGMLFVAGIDRPIVRRHCKRIHFVPEGAHRLLDTRHIQRRLFHTVEVVFSVDVSEKWRAKLLLEMKVLHQFWVVPHQQQPHGSAFAFGNRVGCQRCGKRNQLNPLRINPRLAAQQLIQHRSNAQPQILVRRQNLGAVQHLPLDRVEQHPIGKGSACIYTQVNGLGLFYSHRVFFEVPVRGIGSHPAPTDSRRKPERC